MLQSIHETSKALKLSERHIRRMISEGRWPFYRLGRRAIRIDLEEIMALGRVVEQKKRRQYKPPEQLKLPFGAKA